MTIYERAEQIAGNGMQRKQVFKFFDKVNRDIMDYIILFHEFGIKQDTVRSLYEEWQEEE
jgi:hypothetical protein